MKIKSPANEKELKQLVIFALYAKSFYLSGFLDNVYNSQDVAAFGM